MIVLFDLCRLLACGKAVVRLVPEGGIICRAEFRVEGDVLGGVYFDSASGRVATKFTVVGKWVPEVIQVLSIVRRVLGIIVHGMWVEFCMCVGAPQVSGGGGFGDFGGDLLCVRGIGANELAFAGKEVGCIRERAYAIEALSRVWHGG